MPGANYMGGKRNAARARVKDAAGKVQRDHFGKKRFEILRSGLSRGQASAGQPGIARNGARPVPEISLAHARRAVGGGQRQDVSRGAAPCAFTPPRAKNSCQRSPPSSVSSRSKILRVLDAENPEVQRNQVDKILQIPDLLGLSSAPKRNRPHSVARSSESSRDWRTPPHSREDGHRRQSTPSTSAHLTSPFRYQGKLDRAEHSLHSRSYNRRRTSPHIPSDPNMAFIPLCLDSSPMGRIDDSGYADSWLDAPENDPREDSVDTSYEPARVPFYPDAAFVAKPSSAGGDPVLPSRRRFDSLESLSSWSGTQSYGHLNLDFSTSPPPEQLPLNLTQARFLSDLPSIERVGIDIQMSPDPRTSSDSLHFSWSGTTSHLLESDDVPQASFSLSPPTKGRLENMRISSPIDSARDAGYVSADSSQDFPVADSGHADSLSEAPTNGEAGFSQQVYLVDLLKGALFEDADPWCALNEVLDLPAASLNATTDSLELVNANDRRGVGYLCQPHSDPPFLTDDNLGPAEGYSPDECELRDDLQLGLYDVLQLVPGRVELAQSSDCRHYSPLTMSPVASPVDPVPISGELLYAAASASVGQEVPLPAQASLVASDLDSPVEAPFEGRSREGAETQEMMSYAQASQSSGSAGADTVEGNGARHDGHDVSIMTGFRSCRTMADGAGGLVDGPSLFPDDELVESEDE